MCDLVKRIGAENVYIVSKVGSWAQDMWPRVLQESGFLRRTGMREENIHWVRERTGARGKAPAIVDQLGLTHFADDHVDVLSDVKKHCKERMLQGPQLYIVTTTRLIEMAERWVQNRSYSDGHRARTEARKQGFHFAESLSCIDLPPMP